MRKKLSSDKANFLRPLDTNDLAFQFLSIVLSLDPDHAAELTGDIVSAEILFEKKKKEPTLTHSESRHPKFKTDESRKYLRKQIFTELSTELRLKSDDKIQLGKGGAMPHTIKNERKAVIVTGLPASGKSGISATVADKMGAYILDSDYAKRKFPEYSQAYGAPVLHSESNWVTFGPEIDQKKAKKNSFDEFSLYEYTTGAGFNIVIPKIGYSAASIQSLKSELSKKGYETHLLLVSLDRLESTKRALNRFKATNRYVPLSLIFDGYSNDPILTYYRLKNDSTWSSTGKVSTAGSKSKGPLIIEATNGSPAEFFK